jgi:hypothetical protein
MRVEDEMVREATREVVRRDDWKASMFSGAVAERRRERANAFLLKEGMVLLRDFF